MATGIFIKNKLFLWHKSKPEIGSRNYVMIHKMPKYLIKKTRQCFEKKDQLFTIFTNCCSGRTTGGLGKIASKYLEELKEVTCKKVPPHR